jgi:predicted transcriptional regulator
MGYGYALLPTSEQPVSTMTLRLTPAEKAERDDWIMGAVERGMKIPEIAYEVGLSVQRVSQIVKKRQGPTPEKKYDITMKGKKFRTPRDAALFEYEWERMHPDCRKAMHSFEGPGMCMDCFGMMNIIESEYDKDGWPYSWAMYGQEKYIEAVSERYRK